MSYLRITFVLSVCCLSSLLGEEKDFLDPVSNRENSKEAFTTSEKDDKLNRRARQSFSFSSFQPFAPKPLPSQSSESGSTVGISFQRIRMGPEESAEVQQRQSPSVQSSQFRSQISPSSPDVARPRLTLNELDFKGFEFNQAFPTNKIQPSPTVSNRRNRFQNFQSFQTPTEPTRLRNVQPTLPSSQITRSQFSSFQNTQTLTESPRSRFPSFNLPPNSDPRKRNRNQQSRVENIQRFQNNGASLSNTRAFQPNSIQQQENGSEKSTNRRMRKRLKIVTRVPVTRVPTGQFRQNTDFTTNLSFQPQNTIQESVRSFDKQESFNDDYEDDLLIKNCLKEAEKHAKEIEELENRTALHIDYAQEKQLEIQNLEITLQTLKNQSKIETEKITSLENNILNLTVLIETKDKVISVLKEDITKLEDTFEKEELKKHETIQDLNRKLENTTIELAKSKISLDQTSKENHVKNEELDEAMVKIDKFKREKKNLLRIVQQLAEIGNPSLNFNTFTIGNDEDEYDNYEDYEEVQDYESEDIIVDEDVEVDTSEPDGSGDLTDS